MANNNNELLIELLIEKVESLKKAADRQASESEMETLKAENAKLRSENEALRRECDDLWRNIGLSETPDTPIELLPLISKRTENALKENGIYSLRSLCSCSEADLRGKRRIGSLAIKEIKDCLDVKGYALRGSSAERRADDAV